MHFFRLVLGRVFVKFPSGVLVIVAYMVQTGSMKLFHRGRGLVLATLPSRFKGRANTALAALRYAQALLGPLLAAAAWKQVHPPQSSLFGQY